MTRKKHSGARPTSDARVAPAVVRAWDDLTGAALALAADSTTAPRCRHARTIIDNHKTICIVCGRVRNPSERWREPSLSEVRVVEAARARAVAPVSGPGRLPADEARTHTVEVRVSAIELRELDAYAHSLGCGRSEAVRRAVAAARAT